MKAITYQRYGGPEVLNLKDVPVPTIKENEVLIKTKAVSINPYDWHYMRGKPDFIRFTSGLFKPKEQILGNDVSGVVEQVGEAVSDFKVGDEVFASPSLRALAEYVGAPADRVVLKPSNASHEEASTLIIAAVTAYKSLLEFSHVKAGQEVLINGASGGVGTFTVQIAKHLGAKVTGVCSTKNVNLVKSIGAEDVIDYKQQPPSAVGRRFDVIIDNVGNLGPADLKKLAKPGGEVAIVGFTTMKRMISIMMRRKVGSAKLRVVNFTNAAEDMVNIKSLMEIRAIKPVINKTYSLEDTAEAMEYLESGRVPGKLVISL